MLGDWHGQNIQPGHGQILNTHVYHIYANIICRASILQDPSADDVQCLHVKSQLSAQSRRSESLLRWCHPKAGPTVQATWKHNLSSSKMEVLVTPAAKLTLPYLCSLTDQQACRTALQTDWNCLHNKTRLHSRLLNLCSNSYLQKKFVLRSYLTPMQKKFVIRSYLTPTPWCMKQHLLCSSS